MTRTTWTRAGSVASDSRSMRTVPVKYSAGPFADGCEPLLLMSMSFLHSASNQALQVFGVPGPLQGDLPRSAIDLFQVVRCQLNRARAVVLVEPMPLRRAGNRN